MDFFVQKLLLVFLHIQCECMNQRKYFFSWKSLEDGAPFIFPNQPVILSVWIPGCPPVPAEIWNSCFLQLYVQTQLRKGWKYNKHPIQAGCCAQLIPKIQSCTHKDMLPLLAFDCFHSGFSKLLLEKKKKSLLMALTGVEFTG